MRSAFEKTLTADIWKNTYSGYACRIRSPPELSACPPELSACALFVFTTYVRACTRLSAPVCLAPCLSTHQKTSLPAVAHELEQEVCARVLCFLSQALCASLRAHVIAGSSFSLSACDVCMCMCRGLHLYRLCRCVPVCGETRVPCPPHAHPQSGTCILTINHYSRMSLSTSPQLFLPLLSCRLSPRAARRDYGG